MGSIYDRWKYDSELPLGGVHFSDEDQDNDDAENENTEINKNITAKEK